MKFAITARALVRQREREEGEGAGNGMTEIMAANVRKVTRFRDGGEEILEKEIRRLEREGRRDAARREGGEDGEDEAEGSGIGARRRGGRAERYMEGEGRGGEDTDDHVVERTPQGNDLMRRRR